MNTLIMRNDSVLSVSDNWTMYKYDEVVYRDSTGVVSWAVVLGFKTENDVIMFQGMDEFSHEEFWYPVHMVRQLEIELNTTGKNG